MDATVSPLLLEGVPTPATAGRNLWQEREIMPKRATIIRPFVETTPAEVTDAIRTYCREFTGQTEPTYVPVVPDPWARPLHCVPNVERAVAQRGGDVLQGWLIWQEVRGWFLRFVHHVVWRSPLGLVDVTPQQDGEERILFLADPSVKFEGRLVPGRTIPLVDDVLVRRWCDTQDRLDQWLHRYAVPGQLVDRNEEYDAIEQEFARLSAKLVERNTGHGNRLLTPAARAAERRRRRRRRG